MSQLSQQSDTTQFQFFPQESPTTGRKHPQYSQNNSLLATEAAVRSQRKACPSPLQTSITPSQPQSKISPTTRSPFPQSGAEGLTSTNSPQSPQEQPRSPKDRLNELLASERGFYKTESSSASRSNGIDSKIGRISNNTNDIPRSVSNPALTLQTSGGSPTNTQPTMAATAPAHRAEMGRAPPRTSSIDSAISSLSGGHSHKNSQEMQSGESPDIAHLIQTAGSPEAVIHYLLKEKQSQAAQNAQLWRLVDKQRAMVLGLNKDLERALKDKERYRKKLKENLAQLSNPSPAEPNQAPSDTGSATSSTSKASKAAEAPKAEHVEAIVSAGLRGPEHHEDLPPSPINVALAPYPITPTRSETQQPVLSNMQPAEHMMPSPTKQAYQQYDSEAPEKSEQKLSNIPEVARELPYNSSVPPSRSAPKGPPPSAPPPKAPAPAQTPALSVIEASPNPNEGLRTFPSPPLRKAPPAPLNLGKKEPSLHLRQASGPEEETDSDYDDILEVDEIPTFERGRRKTREDDDRVREIAAAKEAEHRSLSYKSPTLSPKEVHKTPLPASPRPTIPISPPDAHLRHFSSAESQTGSLAGMLSATKPDSSSGLKSPGLPMSPRPMAKTPSTSSTPMHSPPMSPRIGGFAAAVPLSPRAPRQPIPLPPSTPMSMASPKSPSARKLELFSPKPLVISRKGNDPATASPSTSPKDEQQENQAIYRGLVTEEFPDLLLPPNALPSIDVKVASSRLKPSRASLLFPQNIDDDPVFTLAIFARSNGSELWRVEKDSSSLVDLDQLLRKSPYFTATAPEKALFSGHAPAKVDARRAALNSYFDEILDTQMDNESAVEMCKYLSGNTIPPQRDDGSPTGEVPGENPAKVSSGGRPFRNGYLTKRGKNFGGWKARYFVLDGPIFKYYESPGGPHLGTIKLPMAQIGKQNQHADNASPARNNDSDDPDNQYRHAFLILEPKRKDSSSLVRHVLCAESDRERDQWVEALVQWIDYKDPNDEEHMHHSNASQNGHITGMHANKDMHGSGGRSQTAPEVHNELVGISYESTKQGSVPHGARHHGTPTPPTNGHERDLMSQIPYSQPMKSISGPKNAQVIQDAGAWGNRQNLLAPNAGDDKKQKKRSFFGFGPKPRVSTDAHETGTSDSNSNLTQMAYEQHGPIRPAFGAPLSEAVKYNHPADVNIDLPAVVYRCIEYLDAMDAASEEGIFRLSGSNLVIRQLRERFNTEGGVNLITDGQYYDIHAVASLLKLYLRELPTPILTRDLHLEFIATTELHDLNEKLAALNRLVYRLPRANMALLRYLSGFLINVISHSDTNKMTVRNVGIVFSPTLNIPAPVFTLFLQQFESIFGQEPDASSPTVEVTVTAPALSPDDIRSPRRQQFQELPTPSFNQQTFPQSRAPHSFPQPQHYQPSLLAAAYETGYTPAQQEPQSLFSTIAGPEYGSRAHPSTLAGPAYEQSGNLGNPGYQQAPVARNKRRESNMFSMGIGLGPSKKPSSNRLRDDTLVDKESFFDST